MEYPTLEEAQGATREQLARWWRFLPTPQGISQIDIMDTICERFRDYGGFTPALSKFIGWRDK